MYRQNGDLANLLKSARKKSAPECPFDRGDANLAGASLIYNEFKPKIKLTSSFRLANVFASVHLLPPDLSHPYLCPTFALPCPTFVLPLSYLIPILLCPTFLC